VEGKLLEHVRTKTLMKTEHERTMIDMKNVIKLNARISKTKSGYCITLFINEGLLKAAMNNEGAAL
jgi:hypothetical protein